jgi:hypothetical protein
MSGQAGNPTAGLKSPPHTHTPTRSDVDTLCAHLDSPAARPALAELGKHKTWEWWLSWPCMQRMPGLANPKGFR